MRLEIKPVDDEGFLAGVEGEERGGVAKRVPQSPETFAKNLILGHLKKENKCLKLMFTLFG